MEILINGLVVIGFMVVAIFAIFLMVYVAEKVSEYRNKPKIFKCTRCGNFAGVSYNKESFDVTVRCICGKEMNILN